jgi:hypothetical protein
MSKLELPTSVESATVLFNEMCLTAVDFGIRAETVESFASLEDGVAAVEALHLQIEKKREARARAEAANTAKRVSKPKAAKAKEDKPDEGAQSAPPLTEQQKVTAQRLADMKVKDEARRAKHDADEAARVAKLKQNQENTDMATKSTKKTGAKKAAKKVTATKKPVAAKKAAGGGGMGRYTGEERIKYTCKVEFRDGTKVAERCKLLKKFDGKTVKQWVDAGHSTAALRDAVKFGRAAVK